MTKGLAKIAKPGSTAGIRRDKTYKLEYDKENVVDDEWPLSAVSIAGNTKEDGSYRSEHEHQGDTPCNIRLCLVKRLGQTRHRQRNSEEIKRIPRLS